MQSALIVKYGGTRGTSCVNKEAIFIALKNSSQCSEAHQNVGNLPFTKLKTIAGEKVPLYSIVFVVSIISMASLPY